MKKIVAGGIAIALAGLLGYQLYQRILTASSAEVRRDAAAVPVRATPVQKRTIRDRGQFTGSLEARSHFILAPKVPGRLVRLLVNIGDRVERGALIAELDDAEYRQEYEKSRAELAVAAANVAEAQSSLDVATREVERDRTLRKKLIASESELDAGEAAFKAAEAQHKVALAKVEQSQAALKAAEVRLSYTTILATWEDGNAGARFVGERYVDSGAMLRANDPIVSIVDTVVLKAVIYVTERDYPKLSVGQSVQIATDAFPDRSFPGAIVRIAPLLREASRQGRIEIEVPNQDLALKPGMFIRASIEFATHPGVVAVPAAALVRWSDAHGVFLVDATANVARFVPAEVGIVEGAWAEIVRPPPELAAGQVVTLGQHLLENGTPIAVVEGP